jgi:hypothetical protein
MNVEAQQVVLLHGVTTSAADLLGTPKFIAPLDPQPFR